MSDMTEDKELVRFATRALRGLPESHCFVGIYGDGPMTATRAAFLLQLGYAVAHGKTILLPIPHGVEIPAKLRAVADVVVRYNPADPATLEYALRQALTELGSVKQ